MTRRRLESPRHRYRETDRRLPEQKEQRQSEQGRADTDRGITHCYCSVAILTRGFTRVHSFFNAAQSEAAVRVIEETADRLG